LSVERKRCTRVREKGRGKVGLMDFGGMCKVRRGSGSSRHVEDGGLFGRAFLTFYPNYDALASISVIIVVVVTIGTRATLPSPTANMYSTLQRLNNITSLATTYVMILMGLISIASFLSVPSIEPGNIDVKDLIM
jgi:hypothetical protein